MNKGGYSFNSTTPSGLNGELKSAFQSNSKLVGWKDRGNTFTPNSFLRKTLGFGRDVLYSK